MNNFKVGDYVLVKSINRIGRLACYGTGHFRTMVIFDNGVTGASYMPRYTDIFPNYSKLCPLYLRKNSQ